MYIGESQATILETELEVASRDEWLSLRVFPEGSPMSKLPESSSPPLPNLTPFRASPRVIHEKVTAPGMPSWASRLDEHLPRPNIKLVPSRLLAKDQAIPKDSKEILTNDLSLIGKLAVRSAGGRSKIIEFVRSFFTDQPDEIKLRNDRYGGSSVFIRALDKRDHFLPTESQIELGQRWTNITSKLSQGLKRGVDQKLIPNEVLGRIKSATTIPIELYDGIYQHQRNEAVIYVPTKSPQDTITSKKHQSPDHIEVDADILRRAPEVVDIELATALILQMSRGSFISSTTSDNGESVVNRSTIGFHQEDTEYVIGPYDLSNAVARHLAISSLYDLDPTNFDPDQWPEEVYQAYDAINRDRSQHYYSLKTLDYICRRSNGTITPELILSGFFDDTQLTTWQKLNQFVNYGIEMDGSKGLDAVDDVIQAVEVDLAERLVKAEMSEKVVTLAGIFKPEPKTTYREHVNASIDEFLSPRLKEKFVVYNITKLFFSDVVTIEEAEEESDTDFDHQDQPDYSDDNLKYLVHDGNTAEIPVIKDEVAPKNKKPAAVAFSKFTNFMAKFTNVMNRVSRTQVNTLGKN